MIKLVNWIVEALGFGVYVHGWFTIKIVKESIISRKV